MLFCENRNVSNLKLCLILCFILIRILPTHFQKTDICKNVNIKMSIYHFLKCLAYSHLLKYFPLYYVQWCREQKNNVDTRHLEEQMVEWSSRWEERWAALVPFPQLSSAGALHCCRPHVVWEGCTIQPHTCWGTTPHLPQCEMSRQSTAALKN